MKRTVYVLVAVLIVAALLSACGGSGSAASQTGTGQTGGTATASGGTGGGTGGTTGDAKAGEALFAQATIGNNAGCKTCHSLDGSKLVGPTLQGIGARAATRVQGESAEQYIRTSITDPNAHIVEGFPAGVMPSFKTTLSDQQLNDLVAYLLTLK